MLCFSACIKKAEEDFEAKLIQIVEKTIVKVLEEKFPNKAREIEDIIVENKLKDTTHV
jgi:hypothetical protein